MTFDPCATLRLDLSDPLQIKTQMLYWSNRYSICSFLETAGTTHNSPLALVAGVGLAPHRSPTLNPMVLDQWVQEGRDWVFGHLGFPHPQQAPDPEGFGPFFFFVPETVLVLEEQVLTIHSCRPPEAVWAEIQSTPVPHLVALPPAVFRPLMPQAEYLDHLEKILAHIHRGDCYEINFCQYFSAPVTVDPILLYRHLLQQSPNPFSAYYKKQDAHLCCASPERFLEKKGNTLRSQPIKGTAARDLENPQKDLALQQALRDSPKEQRENVMVVDLVRNDMSQVCVPGSVQVTELFGLYRFPQVHQMISTITGQLPANVLPSQIMAACFPMGSMTGAPKAKVLELIAEHENCPRGLYSGALGYFKPGGDFDFNVVIRSLLYNAQQKTLRYGVGSGITAASEPAAEYQECLLKAAAIRALWAH